MSDGGLLIIACGALARELRDVVHANQWPDVAIECLPANLHNRPDEITPLLRIRLERAVDRYERILVGYADCGTGGLLDQLCDEYGIARLPGAHCYEFFAGSDAFRDINDDDPTAFYLTDYLAKHFDRIIMEGLGIERHPELLEMYFGNYTRVVLLTQTGDPSVEAAARSAAQRLGLRFELRSTGYGELETSLLSFVEGPTRHRLTVHS